MDAKTLLDTLNHQIEKQSGLEENRNYLGISKVGKCPRAAYKEYTNGIEIFPDSHRMCFAGYEQEGSVIELLTNGGILTSINSLNIEVVAPFDKRLKGHVDAVTKDKALIEIKSTTRRAFDNILESHRCSSEHFTQIQLYMRYGGWDTAFVIYRCRETYRHQVIKVPYISRTAERFENKAKMILEAIDRKEPPACECGRCE